MSDPTSVTIDIPLESRTRRTSERFGAAMPVRIDGAEAITEDLSSTGLSFVAERSCQLGERIQVTIQYLMDGHNFPLDCEAEVVRVEQVPEGWRIGARLLTELQMLEGPAGADAPMAPRLRQVD